MCRSSGAEIYDLAWSPEATHFIIGSMDNIARIYSAHTGKSRVSDDSRQAANVVAPGTLVRQIAEHSHYVQGVTWDPYDEYIATQSSDRSVHIYSLKTKDGHYTLSQDDKPPRLASHIKADLPPRRISSSSPAPPDFGHRTQLSVVDPNTSIGSPTASAPGTPTSFAVPMNPPSVVSHSRRSSFSRRSASPAPSMPLPAVMPMEASPKPPSMAASMGLGVKNASLYANETLTSFFRRLTFTPDGSLLLTPSGQYQTQHQADKDAKPTYEVINTVYIYTRGGISKPPVAFLPGHKKPSVVVKCSPVFYTLRHATLSTRHITIDTSSAEEPLASLPDPVSKPSPATSVMDPPPPPSAAAPDHAAGSAKPASGESDASIPVPKPAFSLPYRMVYAVATQDTVFLYDTQQRSPFCVVSNLHCATFTDLAWYVCPFSLSLVIFVIASLRRGRSSDGLTLVISSSDGFCSTLSFAPGELGDIYKGETGPPKAFTGAGSSAAMSNQNNPASSMNCGPKSPFHNGAFHHHRNSNASFTAPSPPASAPSAMQRPSSPTRSNSASSVATQSSMHPSTGVVSNPSLIVGSMPTLTAAGGGKAGGIPMTTPPETPRSSGGSATGTKREASESEREEGKEPKKRWVAPTPVDKKPA